MAHKLAGACCGRVPDIWALCAFYGVGAARTRGHCCLSVYLSGAALRESPIYYEVAVYFSTVVQT